MLVVLERVPRASPLEAVLGEEAIAEVALGNLILERLAAIDVWTCSRGLDEQGTVLLSFDAGVVERVDVNSQAQRMVRELVAALNRTIAIARGVVGLHGALVVVVVLRDRTYALYGITLAIQLGKDFLQVVSNDLVADNDALLRLALEVDMQHFQRIQHNTLGLSMDANSQQPENDSQHPLLHQLFRTFFLSLSMASSRLSVGSMML